mgnify:CR=1 FL=1
MTYQLLVPPLPDILQFVKELQASFPTKHLGELEYSLGLEVKRNHMGILSISQNKLLDIILQKFDMIDCSSIATHTLFLAIT